MRLHWKMGYNLVSHQYLVCVCVCWQNPAQIHAQSTETEVQIIILLIGFSYAIWMHKNNWFSICAIAKQLCQPDRLFLGLGQPSVCRKQSNIYWRTKRVCVVCEWRIFMLLNHRIGSIFFGRANRPGGACHTRFTLVSLNFLILFALRPACACHWMPNALLDMCYTDYSSFSSDASAYQSIPLAGTQQTHQILQQCTIAFCQKCLFHHSTVNEAFHSMALNWKYC